MLQAYNRFAWENHSIQQVFAIKPLFKYQKVHLKYQVFTQVILSWNTLAFQKHSARSCPWVLALCNPLCSCTFADDISHETKARQELLLPLEVSQKYLFFFSLHIQTLLESPGTQLHIKKLLGLPKVNTCWLLQHSGASVLPHRSVGETLSSKCHGSTVIQIKVCMKGN